MRRPAFAAFAALLLTLPLMVGCSSVGVGGSALAVTSRDNTGSRLRGDFDTAYYAYDGENAVTVVLIAGPEDEPTQAAAIRLFWTPRAGKTPLSEDATNSTVQYVVFADRRTEAGFFREVGVYSGAGFLYLDEKPGSAQLTGSLWQADLLLADRSERFRDLLGLSRIAGSFTARRDEHKVNQLLHQLNTRVTQRLGYPRLVRAED
ncbi:MAG: hypothetical protein ACIAXF_15705 [Phycisphaerales bacterium JB063]